MLKFSILCPTRKRPTFIQDLIKNINDTVGNLNNVELIIIHDEDDFITGKILSETHTRGKSFYYLKRERSEYLNRDYYNYLASISSGKYLWAIGDDVRFLTKHWDILLEARIEEYLKDKKDRVGYIYVYEDKSQAKHPCFPLITKEAFKVLGMYFHPELLSWGADRCLWELYSGVDRILQIPEIHIQHFSYHDKTAEYDETAKSMRDRFFRDPNCHNKVVTDIVPGQIEFLRKYLNDTRVEKSL